MPLISVVSGLVDPNIDDLRACIKSVISQTCEDWEWCIVADYPTEPKIKKLLIKAANNDSRLRIHFRNTHGGEYEALQEAFDAAAGTFVAVLNTHSELHCNALSEVAAVFDQNNEVDYLYTDEDIVNADGVHTNVFLKPEFDPIRLMTNNYCSNLSVFRSTLLDKIGGIRQKYAEAAMYDLILRATEQARVISHIPKVLYHGNAQTPSEGPNTQKVIEDHLARIGLKANVSRREHGGFSVTPEIAGDVKVSVVIPTRGTSKVVWGVNTCLVNNAIESLLRNTDYKNFEVIVIYDFKSGIPVNPISIPEDPRVKILPYDAPFNFSEKCNLGVQSSNGEVVVLLNDDVQIEDPNWLSVLVSMLQFPNVGMAGPMLLLEDSRIQSAGHTNNPTPLNFGSGQWPNERNASSLFNITRCVSGVTAACAAIRRDTYDQLGGLSTDFPASFNDVDFANKLLEFGQSIVWTPLTRLYHFESLSRDPTASEHELAMLNKRWSRTFGKDPFSPQPA